LNGGWTDGLVGWLTDLFLDSFIDLLVNLFIYWLVDV